MAMTEQRKRDGVKRQGIIGFGILYVIGSIYSLHVGAAIPQFSHITILNLDALFSTATAHMLKQPFFLPQVGSWALKIWYGFSIIYFAIFVAFLSSSRKWMRGKEHGTARWGRNGEATPFQNKNFIQNIILTATERLSLDARKIRRNLNVLVIGDSGSGKSRFYVKPNLMQAHTSYVVTDLKGELLEDTGKMLENQGYQIRVFNLIDMEHSHCYSPFAYLRKDEDVLRLINCLIKNTTPPTSSTNDPFWEKAETALLEALFFFIWSQLPEAEQNFNSVMRLLDLVSISEADDKKKSDLDLLFEQLAKKEPTHIAVRQYNIFKHAAGKTAKSIVVSAAVRLAAFNVESVANLTHKDTLHLEDLFQTDKTALFVLIPAGDTTFNFIAAILYSQMFQFFREEAFHNKNKALPYHVRFLLDEFANIGTIPDFGEMLSVMRSMNFSASVILQNMEQLEKGYKDSMKTIIANCNSKLYLGGDEQSTTKMVSEMLGKETIDTRNWNKTHGRQLSLTKNDQILGRELMMADEIGRMPDTDCILMIKGIYPFYSQKYDITKHPRYQELHDPDIHPENRYDYNKIVTPVRPTPEPLKPAKKEVNLREIEIGIEAIQKMRYAIEYEF